MKTLLLLALFAQTTSPNATYPVRFQIVYETHRITGKGNGQGNVYDENLGIRGVDFIYQGCREVPATRGNDRDRARWKSQGQLVVLNPATGNECILGVTFHPWIYVVAKDGTVTTKPIGKDGGGDKRYHHQ